MTEPPASDRAAEAPAHAFPFEYPVSVRFRDLDPMGHAHHSLPLIYFEEARAAFWRRITGRDDLESIDYVIAGVRVRFLERVRFPLSAKVGLRVARIGNSSFSIEYELRGPGGRLLVEGSTDQVLYDYDAGRSKVIPREIRRELEAATGA
ncbi:MAG TPA: thioesterase family protein [Longimicrobiales bacterium]|nr:thioesterase family protein [Longimicrobiales bacterium]